MRALGGPAPEGEAKLLYTDSSVQVLVPGRYVRCAVTGEKIALEDLKYWSAARQEPYADAAASAKAMRLPKG
jgi:hypothetical protein